MSHDRTLGSHEYFRGNVYLFTKKSMKYRRGFRRQFFAVSLNILYLKLSSK